MRLSFVVVGVLSEDDGLDVCKGRQFETIVNVVHIGVDDVMRIFVFEKFAYLFVIFAFEQGRERLVPAAAEFDHFFIPPDR